MNYYSGRSKWVYYNPNPRELNVGDCVIRALCKTFGVDWRTMYKALADQGYKMCDMPSANHVWGAFLRKNGYTRSLIDDHEQDVYTIEDFCMDNPRGDYVLATQGHVVAVSNGKYYDAWDSGKENPIYLWRRNE